MSPVEGGQPAGPPAGDVRVGCVCDAAWVVAVWVVAAWVVAVWVFAASVVGAVGSALDSAVLEVGGTAAEVVGDGGSEVGVAVPALGAVLTTITTVWVATVGACGGGTSSTAGPFSRSAGRVSARTATRCSPPLAADGPAADVAVRVVGVEGIPGLATAQPVSMIGAVRQAPMRIDEVRILIMESSDLSRNHRGSSGVIVGGTVTGAPVTAEDDAGIGSFQIRYVRFITIIEPGRTQASAAVGFLEKFRVMHRHVRSDRWCGVAGFGSLVSGRWANRWVVGGFARPDGRVAAMTEQLTLGRLVAAPAVDRSDLLAPPVIAALADFGAAAGVFVAAIDPDLADTAAFCAAYDVGLDVSANCVVVSGKRAGEQRWAAAVVLATARADVNGVVRRRMDVRKVSFAAMADAVEATGMQYGGITPIGLPDGWPILIDAAVAAAGPVVIGSGIRGSKIIIDGAALAGLPGAEVIEGLANPI